MLELAGLLMKKNDKAGAIDQYLGAAKAFSEDKNPHKASAAAKQALQVDPKNIGAHEFLAEHYGLNNLKEDQRTVLKKLVDIYFEIGDQAAVARAREKLKALGPGR